ncbi:hypothetical protein [Streptomyces sp. NPDC008141]|uniref:hypothetical protein n=1 Tax=Streptomyces sp. NPDC008141 TaxID=3364815 RepID=UPI0036E7B601
MTTSRLTFLVDARDQASRVFGHIGDSAIRLHRRLDDTSDRGGAALDRLKKSVISLAPAAIPAAAAMAPLVASTAAAGVAVGVYAAALGPQIAAMGEASEAEKKYQDAVEKSGARSKEAVQAQQQYVQTMAKLPPATRTAAAALSVLKDQYKAWSDATAGDTMGPVVKGMAVLGGLLPKLTPLVRGTSTELNRMMTIVAGGMESPGFDRLVGKFTTFATGTLRRVNDGIIDLARSLDTGKVGGGFTEFMTFARAQGPVVGDTLRNIAQAVMNLLVAGSDVGVGMLQLVNVLSKLIAAVPPGAISTFLQLAIAIKAVKLAAAGFAAAQGAIAAFGGSLVAMRSASGGAATGMGRVSAAMGALSRSARLAIAGTGIGLLVLGLMELSEVGKKAPTDLDRMTVSLGKFALTGQLTGEAAKSSGKNFEEFDKAIKGLSDPSGLDKVQQSLTRLVRMDSTPVKEWKTTVDDIDKGLANMVKSGNAEGAAAALDGYIARLKASGRPASDLTKHLGDYRAAQEAARYEQELAARSMGLFGQQALNVQGRLDSQKASTDGLRQSINALTNATLVARGGMRGMEAAIDAASKAASENGKTLDINTEKGRANSQALDDLSAATIKAAEGARENGASWTTVNGIYDRGYNSIVKSARAMGLSETAARKLASQILKTPDKTARLKGNMEDLQGKLNLAKKRLASVPDSRKAAIRAEISDLQLKIAQAKYALSNMDKDYTVWVHYKSTGSPYRPSGGREMAVGGLVKGPGTSTSDSIPTWLSNGEYVMPAKRVAQLGVGFFDSIKDGKVGTALPAPRAAVPRVQALSAPSATVYVQPIHVTVTGTVVDPAGAALAIDKLLTTRKRNSGGQPLTFEKQGG